MKASEDVEIYEYIPKSKKGHHRATGGVGGGAEARNTAGAGTGAGAGGSSECIDTTGISPSAALQRFEDNEAARGRGATVFMMAAAGESSSESRRKVPESLKRRLGRLQAETETLARELGVLTDDTPAGGPSHALYRGLMVELSAGAAKLQTDLAQLADAAGVLPQLPPSSEARGEHAVAATLAAQVDAEVRSFTASAHTAGGAAESERTGPSNAVVYEVYGDVEGASGSGAAASVSAALESRVAALEHVLGTRHATTHSLRGGTIVAALTEVDRTLALLNPSRVARLLDQTRALTEQFEKLHSSKKKVGKAWLSAQKLLNLVQPWEAFAGDLPALVERLRSLQALHEQSALTTQRLAAVEAAQARIEKSLAADQLLLREIANGLEANLATVAENVSHLDDRIAKLAADFAGKLEAPS